MDGEAPSRELLYSPADCLGGVGHPLRELLIRDQPQIAGHEAPQSAESGFALLLLQPTQSLSSCPTSQLFVTSSLIWGVELYHCLLPLVSEEGVQGADSLGSPAAAGCQQDRPSCGCHQQDTCRQSGTSLRTPEKMALP